MALTLLRSAKINIGKGPLPDRLVVLRWGENEAAQAGKVIVNETTLAELPRNQASTNFDRVALDFNHNTVEGSKWYQGEPAKVAAFATPAVIEGEGLVFTDLEWTPDGEEYVGKKHYIDLSAAVKMNDRGEVVFCHSAGVCRQGQVKDLHILAADPFENRTANMNPEKLKELLITLLSAVVPGITAESSDQEIEEAAKKFAEGADAKRVTALAAEVADLKSKLKAAQEKAGDPKPTSETSPEIAALSSRIDQLTRDHEKREREAIRREAIAAGKIVPLAADKLPIDDFRQLVGELPENQVPMDQRTPEGVQAFAASGMGRQAGEQAEADAEVRRRLGISEDAWKKHAS